MALVLLPTSSLALGVTVVDTAAGASAVGDLVFVHLARPSSRFFIGRRRALLWLLRITSHDLTAVGSSLHMT